MSGSMQFPAGFEDLLRGSVRGGAQVPVRGPGPSPARHGAVPTSAMDVQQLSDMLDAQFRLREAAQAGRAQAVRALVATAEALCPNQWDNEKRAGQSPDEWSPERIGEFVVRHMLVALQQGYLAQQPDLAANYERANMELAAARDEISRLKLQLLHAQKLAQTEPTQAAPINRTKRGVRALVRPPHAGSGSNEMGNTTGDEDESASKLESVPQARVDAVIKLMAATGLSRSDAVRERLGAEWGVRSGSSRIGEPVRAALHRGLADTCTCNVEWPGEATREFLVLTPAGRARAVELGIVPVESEFEAGMKLHKTANHLYLVLKAADILRAEGLEEVTYLPECVQVSDGEYCPDIRARTDDRHIHIECERSRFKAREAKWTRAAEANGGMIYLVTPNRKIMDAITSEIKATTGNEFKLWAFNIRDYGAKNRGADGSIWTHQR